MILVAPLPKPPWAPPEPELVTEIRRSPGGGVLIDSERWGRRWIPDHWVLG